ncbi:MAG: biopolymer transporter Tol [Cephaloticoccus sp.]|nr:biopolymer transporter Tol [Cephaloticoccus sp.]MCF7760341.1 biopolymer transporter Tol [Cephaloticoccus sp.]
MQNLTRLFLCLFFGLSVGFAQRNIGDVIVTADIKTVSVRVSANVPELNNLAQLAFSAHGRYRLANSGFGYDIRFTQVATNQVQVDIERSGGAKVLSQVVSGTDARNALLRAADVAVEQTNGLGLKGFFAAKLTFIGERTNKKEVYTSDLFFGDTKQITRDNTQALTPRWSADGRKIIYTSFFRSGFPDIFQIDLGSYQRTSFVSFKGTNSGARFSPNGQQVAMVLSGEGSAEIYVGNAQGKQIRRLTRTDAVEASPCFSPDGSRLVFTSDAAGGPQLYTISVGGGTMRRVPTNISGYCAEPDWSRANPNKIAFTIRIGSGYQIAVYDFSKGTAAVQASHAPFDGVEPCWLGDGRHLVYTARDQRTSRICILDTETGKSTAISPVNFGPAFQGNVWLP